MEKTDSQWYIINKLKQKRIQRGNSQKDIADFLEISVGLIGNIESTKYPHKYTLKQIKLLCQLYNTPIEQLFLSVNELSESKDVINLLIDKIINYGE